EDPTARATVNRDRGRGRRPGTGDSGTQDQTGHPEQEYRTPGADADPPDSHHSHQSNLRSAGAVVGPDVLRVVAGGVALGPPLRGPLVALEGDHGAAGVCAAGLPGRL